MRRRLTVLAVFLGLICWSTPASAEPIPEPHADPFYQAPGGFASEAPGTVLRSRPVTVTGLGMPVPVDARQALTRSTDARGRPVAVVTTLMVPRTPWTGNRPLVSYQPATDSLGDQCNPSYTLRTSEEKELGLMSMALSHGWAVVVTDYEGPRNAFAAGPMAGHAVLDGIRAAQRLPGLAGSDTPVGLWGYSGGALATSWAAELQPHYAPELGVVGVASGGTPGDLEAAARQIDGSAASGLVLLASVGIGREYPEMLSLLNDRGREMVGRIGDMCVGDAVMAFPFRRLNEFTHSPDPLSEPVSKQVLAENDLGQPAPKAPVFLYHSIMDQLIPFATAKALGDEYCRQGTLVLFHADPASEHSSLALSGAPLAVAYLGARFAGLPAPDNCLSDRT
jgi:hypothetical protein